MRQLLLRLTVTISSDAECYENGSTKVEGDVVKLSESAKSNPEDAPLRAELDFRYSKSQRMGVTGAVFVVLNEMIGIGIFPTLSGILASTGSVGVPLFLWVIRQEAS